MGISKRDELLSRWRLDPAVTYLDSATYGLPPQATIDVLKSALQDWQTGRANWIDWDQEAEHCRHLFAELIHATAPEVALMPAVSVASGLVATAVPDGGEVLVPNGEFTSVTFPFAAAAQQRNISLREVPLEALADSVGPRTALVATSLVQSADGRVADLDAISEAARSHGAQLYVDASQALSVVPTDVARWHIDYLACGAYKWLCCPRGVAFLFVREGLWQEPWPVTASWRAGDDPYGRFYGSTLALAANAARFDVSLAWHSWVGARPSLEALVALGDEARFDLANGRVTRLAAALDLAPPGAGILSVPVRDSQAAKQALDQAGIRASVRTGQIRISAHVYSTDDDVDRAVEVLRPHLQAST